MRSSFSLSLSFLLLPSSPPRICLNDEDYTPLYDKCDWYDYWVAKGQTITDESSGTRASNVRELEAISH